MVVGVSEDLRTFVLSALCFGLLYTENGDRGKFNRRRNRDLVDTVCLRRRMRGFHPRQM